jgi:hypothetical protein
VVGKWYDADHRCRVPDHARARARVPHHEMAALELTEGGADNLRVTSSLSCCRKSAIIAMAEVSGSFVRSVSHRSDGVQPNIVIVASRVAEDYKEMNF